MPSNNANIDERVVEMRIDNRQFVDGAEKTISVLDKLKKALSFRDVDDGFSDIQRSADKVDLSGMASDIEAISNRFSTMGLVGMQVIKNLTDSVTNFITNTIKGLTISPIAEGFQKYEEIARYTATIMGATRNEVGKWGEGTRFETQLDYVKDGLKALTWYADETSAAMTDMVANVGKFTNAGVEFEHAVVQMMGVTNWGYQAGASKAEQARAMYNLSQAIATGTVKLMDWRSIENANMATLEFKDTVLETAARMGALKKETSKTGEVIYKTLNGVKVSSINFAESLKENWFTGDVLQQVLTDYGRYSATLNDILHDTKMANFGIGASQLIEWSDAVKEGTMSLEDLQSVLKERMNGAEIPIETLSYAMARLNDETLDLSKRAFLAGQEYKTFGDAIDATKDAVSSSWMTTFELIIGDAEEAKAVWSSVGETMLELFNSGSAIRNAILGFWRDPKTFMTEAYRTLESGREILFGTDRAFATLYNGIKTYIQPIINAFSSVFSFFDSNKVEQTAVALINLSKRFEKWTHTIALSDKAVEGMQVAFTKLFEIVKKVIGVFKPAFNIFATGIRYLKDFVELFFESFSSGSFDFNYFSSGMTTLFGSIWKSVKNAWESVKGFYGEIKQSPIVTRALSTIEKHSELIWNFFTRILNNIRGIKTDLPSIEGASSTIENLWSKIVNWFSNIKIDTNQIKEDFGKIGEIISTIYQGIVGDPEAFKERISSLAKNAIAGLKQALTEIKISDIFEGAKTGTMMYIAVQFAQFVTSFKKAAQKFETIPKAITGTFESLSKTIESYGKAQDANTMLKMAGAIIGLAAAMWVLSKIPEDKLASVTVTLGFFFLILTRIAKNLSKIGDQFSNNKNNLIVNILPQFAANVIAIAILLGVAAAAIIKVSKLSWGDIGKGLTVIAGTLATVVLSMIWLSKKMDNDINIKALGKLVTVAFVIKAAGTAMSKFKDMDWTQILSAGFAISMVLAVLMGAIAVMNKSSAMSGIGSMVSLMSFVAALYLMIPMLLGINSMISSGKSENLLKTIGILALLGTVIVTFAGIMTLLGKSGGAIKGAATLALIAAAFVLFSASLAISVPPILALFTGLIGIMELIKKKGADIEGTLATLFGLSAVMVVAGAGAVLLGAGMLQAGAGFAAFGAGALLVAAAIGILSAVLVPFAYALTEFCNVIAENGEVIVKIISVVIASVLAAMIASKLKIAYSVLAIILAVISIIHEYGPQILTMIAVIAEDLLKFLLTLVPTIIKFLVVAAIMIIDGAANSIRSNKEAIISALENLISAILELFVHAFFQLVGDMFSGLWSLIGTFFNIPKDDLNNAAADIHSAFGYLGEKASSGINAAFGGLDRDARDSASSLISSFSDEFANGKDNISGVLSETVSGAYGDAAPKINSSANESGKNSILTYVSGMKDGFNENGGISDIPKAVLSQLDQTKNTTILGGNSGIGYANGAASKQQENYDAGVLLALAQQSGFTDTLQIKSPSKVAIRLSKFFGQGLVNGMISSAPDVQNASEDLANKMLDAIQNALTTVASLADEDFDLSPTITPVVDMSNVDSAAGTVSDMFASTSSMKAGQIGRTMADLDRLSQSMRQFTENKNSVSNDKYEINIYPQPGMDEEAIADAVVFRLSNGVVRKGVALG